MNRALLQPKSQWDNIPKINLNENNRVWSFHHILFWKTIENQRDKTRSAKKPNFGSGLRVGYTWRRY